MNKILLKKTCSTDARKAVQILLNSLDKRLPVNLDMILASLMDPAIQHLPIIKEYMAKHQIDMADVIHEKWVNYKLSVDNNNTSPVKTSKFNQNPKVGNAPKRIRLELVEKHCSTSASTTSPLECIRREVNKYTSLMGVVEEPLDWWRKNKAQFPYLSEFAKIQLSFMATSAIVERHFSKCGVLITKRKANLDPMSVQKILFIHENYHVLTF